MLSASGEQIEKFVELSAELTGFSCSELRSTGMAKVYSLTCISMCGAKGFELMLGYCGRGGELINCQRTRPFAAAIIRLWYLGEWAALPSRWISELEEDAETPAVLREVIATLPGQRNEVVSAEAYRQGLAWRAMRVHPPGANHPGFASWEEKPR